MELVTLDTPLIRVVCLEIVFVSSLNLVRSMISLDNSMQDNTTKWLIPDNNIHYNFHPIMLGPCKAT